MRFISIILKLCSLKSYFTIKICTYIYKWCHFYQPGQHGHVGGNIQSDIKTKFCPCFPCFRNSKPCLKFYSLPSTNHTGLQYLNKSKDKPATYHNNLWHITESQMVWPQFAFIYQDAGSLHKSGHCRFTFYQSLFCFGGFDQPEYDNLGKSSKLIGSSQGKCRIVHSSVPAYCHTRAPSWNLS